VFTSKNGSLRNIVETIFRKMARSMLRGILLASRQELIDRIHDYFAAIKADLVVFCWKTKWMKQVLNRSTERLSSYEAIQSYTREVSLLLKPGCLFKFQAQGQLLSDVAIDGTSVGVVFSHDHRGAIASLTF
jgi:hypothetical protein